MPPHYELRTRPDGLHDIDLPPAIDSAAVNAWALNSIDNHRRPIAAATDAVAVQASLAGYASRFDDAFVVDVANVLLWFSGKDLFAGNCGLAQSPWA